MYALGITQDDTATVTSATGVAESEAVVLAAGTSTSCLAAQVSASIVHLFDSGRSTSMSKSNRNTGKPWSAAKKAKLAELAKGNTPTRVIGLKLGRTEDSIRSQAARQSVSLKPTNQSPYNRRSR